MRSASRILCGVFPAIGMILAGCAWFSDGSNREALGPPPREALAQAVQPRLWGQSRVCAVTGDPFAINSDSRSAVFRGRRYFFRDPQALEAFLDAPEGYAPPPISTPDSSPPGSP